MMQNKQTIGILIIVTGKYGIFLKQLVDSLHKYFLVDYKLNVHIFSDNMFVVENYNTYYDRITLISHLIPPFKFPFASLFRYKSFMEYESHLTEDVLYYLDVDMRVNMQVGEEILPEGEQIVVTRHPGFYKGGWGSNNTHEQSLAWLPIEKRYDYVCGGFNGGERKKFLEMSNFLNENILKDLDTAIQIGFTDNDGILAEYHDETFLNFYIKEKCEEKDVKVLPPDYCYPESWDIPFEKKILALDKDHKSIRE